MLCLLTPSHVYLGRLKPSSQELLMLFSIPAPAAGPQAAVPVAAWLPHARKPAAAGFRVWQQQQQQQGGAGDGGTVVNTVTNSVSNSGVTVVPVSVLALGWGSRVVMFEVPLIGDHVNLGEQGEKGGGFRAWG